MEDNEKVKELGSVGIKGTDEGLKVILLDTNGEIMREYCVKVDISKYTDDELYKKGHDISQRVGINYYLSKGELSQEKVEKIVNDRLSK